MKLNVKTSKNIDISEIANLEEGFYYFSVLYDSGFGVSQRHYKVNSENGEFIGVKLDVGWYSNEFSVIYGDDFEKTSFNIHQSDFSKNTKEYFDESYEEAKEELSKLFNDLSA